MATKVKTDEKGYMVRANYTFRDHGFGVTDHKGREIGARCAAWEIEMVPVSALEESTCWTSEKAPGIYFVFRPQALRGGKEYGAVQSDQVFTDARSREAAMEKYLRGAKSRALKTWTPCRHGVKEALKCCQGCAADRRADRAALAVRSEGLR